MWPFISSKRKVIQEALKAEINKLPESGGWDITPTPRPHYIGADGSRFSVIFRWKEGICFHRQAGGQTWAFAVMMSGYRYYVVCGPIIQDTLSEDVKMNRTLSRKDTLALLESLTVALKGGASP